MSGENVPVGKMHVNEADIEESLVRRLVAEQFPRWADLPIRAVRSTGTVNAIFRIGDHMYARLPRVREWAEDIEKEWTWLPKLAPHLSLKIPEPIEKGRPTESYPFSWAVYEWIEGLPYSDGLVADEHRAARDLSKFVLEMRSIEPTPDAPRGGRAPLRELDTETRAAIAASRGVINVEAATAAWELALEAPEWKGDPVWIHADLMRPNVLVRDGRIRAVIDFGAVGIGDPASDVIAAWEVFGHAGRKTFRAALDVDEGTWNRARGYALTQAAMIIPYYAETNPEFVALAKLTVEEILADIHGEYENQ